MIRSVIADTGPLFALIDKADQHHAWVEEQVTEILPPLLTCDAVVTEACHLARRLNGGTDAVLELFERGVCRLLFDLEANFAHVASLVRRYASVPMSLADGCLVRMSELVPDCRVFTLDGDFRIYRRHKRQPIPLLIPPTL